MKRSQKYLAWSGGVLLLGIVALLVTLFSNRPRGPLATARLADGRILRIEGVTFGKEHRIGQPSFILEHFGPWLPGPVRKFLEPKRPESKFTRSRRGCTFFLKART